jgi:hypothetical protein
VAYVQGLTGDQEGEFVFELVAEGESERAGVYFFVLTHGYQDEVPLPPGRVH